MKTSYLLLFGLFACTSFAWPAQAADNNGPSSTEIRLRESLRSVTQQLNDAQAQLQAAQLTQADTDKKLADTLIKLDDLTKQARQDHQTAQAEILSLKQHLADAERLVQDRELKNLELFKTANEILTRYEKFSLGDALGAKEPFTGNMRVKLENLVQDYQDKLIAQRARSTDVASASSADTEPLPSSPSTDPLPTKPADTTPAGTQPSAAKSGDTQPNNATPAPAVKAN